MSTENENPPTLSYASPDTTDRHGPLATAAILLAILPFVLLPVLCGAGGTISASAGSLVLISPPTALLLGILGWRESRVSDRDRQISRIAVIVSSIQLVLMLAIMLILPQLGAPKERALRVKCASNLRQIGQYLLLYANDHNRVFPPKLDLLIAQSDAPSEIFVCASSNDGKAIGPTTQAVLVDFAKPGRCSYIYLGAGHTLSSVFADQIIAYEPLMHHEGEGMNVLFDDGHVEWVSKDVAQHYISELAAGHNPPRGPMTGPSTMPTTQP